MSSSIGGWTFLSQRKSSHCNPLTNAKALVHFFLFQSKLLASSVLYSYNFTFSEVSLSKRYKVSTYNRHYRKSELQDKDVKFCSGGANTQTAWHIMWKFERKFERKFESFMALKEKDLCKSSLYKRRVDKSHLQICLISVDCS